MKQMSSAFYQSLSYNKLGALLASGQIDERDLLRYYREARRRARGRVGAIERAGKRGVVGVEWLAGERPVFMLAEQLRTSQDLVAAVADVNRFLSSGSSSLSMRVRQRDKRIETLHSHGFDFVHEGNIAAWGNFMQWFKNSAYSSQYDSNDDVVQEVFEELQFANSSEWEFFFKEWAAKQ